MTRSVLAALAALPLGAALLAPLAPRPEPPRTASLAPWDAERIASEAAVRLGYELWGAHCASAGDGTSRCMVRVRGEPEDRAEGDVILLSWRCAASGCWQEAK